MFSYLVLVFSIFFISLFAYYINNYVVMIFSIKDRNYLYNHFNELIAILEIAKETAYNRVYRESVVVNAASDFMIRQAELEKIQEEFIKDVLLLCGPSVVDDLVRLYGDEDALCMSLAYYVQTRLIQDESSLNNLKQSEDMPDISDPYSLNKIMENIQ